MTICIKFYSYIQILNFICTNYNQHSDHKSKASWPSQTLDWSSCHLSVTVHRWLAVCPLWWRMGQLHRAPRPVPLGQICPAHWLLCVHHSVQHQTPETNKFDNDYSVFITPYKHLNQQIESPAFCQQPIVLCFSVQWETPEINTCSVYWLLWYAVQCPAAEYNVKCLKPTNINICIWCCAQLFNAQLSNTSDQKIHQLLCSAVQHKYHNVKHLKPTSLWTIVLHRSVQCHTPETKGFVDCCALLSLQYHVKHLKAPNIADRCTLRFNAQGSCKLTLQVQESLGWCALRMLSYATCLYYSFTAFWCNCHRLFHIDQEKNLKSTWQLTLNNTTLLPG